MPARMPPAAGPRFIHAVWRLTTSEKDEKVVASAVAELPVGQPVPGAQAPRQCQGEQPTSASGGKQPAPVSAAPRQRQGEQVARGLCPTNNNNRVFASPLPLSLHHKASALCMNESEQRTWTSHSRSYIPFFPEVFPEAKRKRLSTWSHADDHHSACQGGGAHRCSGIQKI